MADIEEKVIINLTVQGAVNLAEAILSQAAHDYIYQDNGKKHDDPKKEVERFIKSPWFQTLSMGSMDPDSVLKNLDIQHAYQSWRESMGCTKCDKNFYDCPHRSNDHYTIYEKDLAFCPKKDNSGVSS